MCCHCPLLSAMLPSDIPSFLGVLYPISTLFSRSAPKPERQPGSISVWQRDGTLHIEGPLTDWHHKLLMRRSLLVTTQKAWREKRDPSNIFLFILNLGAMLHMMTMSILKAIFNLCGVFVQEAILQIAVQYVLITLITSSSAYCSLW